MRHFAVVVGRHDPGALHAGRPLRIANVAAQPLFLAAPVHILVGLPHIGPAASKTKSLETHAFQGDVAGQNDQVSPRKLLAIFLFDRPQQAAGFVQADIVRPAVERRKALLAATGTAAAIADTVSAGAVPGHADKERAVVPKVRRPPVLRVGHQRCQVFFYCRQIKGFKRFSVIKGLPHRVRL